MKVSFNRKDGKLTAYALACGYIQREAAHLGGEVTLYHEGACYHVRTWDVTTGRREWLTFRLLEDARKAYRQARALMRSRAHRAHYGRESV